VGEPRPPAAAAPAAAEAVEPDFADAQTMVIKGGTVPCKQQKGEGGGSLRCCEMAPPHF
jgi:hypothetical protein